MNKKSLRGLNRRELLEIMLEQAKRIEKLEKSLADVNSRLESKRILLNNSNTLAEASLKLSDIFKKADEAIQIYKFNVEEALKEDEKLIRKQYKELQEKMILRMEEKYKIKEQKL